VKATFGITLPAFPPVLALPSAFPSLLPPIYSYKYNLLGFQSSPLIF
jgi:hypothetical protein